MDLKKPRISLENGEWLRDILTLIYENQTYKSVSEILNVESAADHIFLLYCHNQPPIQRSVSPILTSKFDTVAVDC